ncbi:MAG: LexA family transcriptional regulator [Bacteroidota bacterium]
MSQIGQNIRKIRSAKKLSQTQFAELFDLTRGSVGAYEEGRAEPKIDTIIQIANYFSVSIDLLLNKEMTVNDLFHLDVFRKKLNEAHSFDTKVSAPSAPNGVEYITIKNQLEYVVNNTNKDFIANLPKVGFPVNREKPAKQLQAFELGNSEMEYNQNGLHHGDILLAEKISESKNLSKGNVYVVVDESGICIRRLKSKYKSSLIFSSDNPNYADRHFSVEDIYELWQVLGFYSTYLNPPKLIDNKVLEFEKRIELLEKQQSDQR